MSGVWYKRGCTACKAAMDAYAVYPQSLHNLEWRCSEQMQCQWLRVEHAARTTLHSNTNAEAHLLLIRCSKSTRWPSKLETYCKKVPAAAVLVQLKVQNIASTKTGKGGLQSSNIVSVCCILDRRQGCAASPEAHLCPWCHQQQFRRSFSATF